MKRIIAIILGWISVVAGALFALIALLLLINGKPSVAGIFVIPGVALLIAGSNLVTYGKRKTTSDINGLSKG